MVGAYAYAYRQCVLMIYDSGIRFTLYDFTVPQITLIRNYQFLFVVLLMMMLSFDLLFVYNFSIECFDIRIFIHLFVVFFQ